MARQYIPINSVDDIDVSRISLATINNRYIDRSGNRYATRFNKRTRKIDIVRIALGKEEALQAKVSRISSKLAEVTAPENMGTKHPAPWKLPNWLNALKIQPREDLDVNEYVLGLERETEKMSERIRGLISNMKNSGAFENKKEGNQDVILELTTYFDREIQDHLSKTQNRLIELQRFPKPNSHYIATLDRRQKMFVEKLNSDKQKEYLRAFLIGQSYLNALHGCFTIIDTANNEFDKVNTERMPYDKKQFLENARTTAQYLREALLDETAKVLGWLKKAEVI